jgi:hypothetical protein
MFREKVPSLASKKRPNTHSRPVSLRAREDQDMSDTAFDEIEKGALGLFHH